jgi:hypothetical protein
MQPHQVDALPAFADTDLRMLHDGMQVVVVEPGHAKPVRRALDHRGLEHHPILVTHRHHGDSVGDADAPNDERRRRVHDPVHDPVRDASSHGVELRARRRGAPSDDPVEVFAPLRA